MSLITCEICKRHHLIDESCSHCNSNAQGRKRLHGSTIAVLLGLSSLSVGCPPVMSMYGVPEIDNDGDGFFEYEDCDDTNPEINPNAEDQEGDGIDQNCDGVDGIAKEDTGDE